MDPAPLATSSTHSYSKRYVNSFSKTHMRSGGWREPERGSSKDYGSSPPFLTGPATVESPEGIKPFQRASPEEQLRRANVVLRAVRRLYRARFGALWECLQAEPHGGNIEAEYARRLLRVMLNDNNLPAWERHPSRKRADVYRLLDAAIRRSSMLKGGWFCAVPGGRAP